ncbi:surfeit locus protein 6 homolog isoform X1 [Melitaea cinxia]|uniref:surfeit locus protein 6 homolog isoform X1 n=2 Tax=Melitaea cinxia TaxID=113334 RepID=UPI001E271A1C|nr:surfeit locus protein 6 homolog isoform X1 [Melitaea cinxia]XP_045451727.1 surfeit locus protein 6 homolog isoform X1 [Melitaea cinxia]XP_045451734.1 surfeit locus protein 6 homolog isoform X1 [Melitaea cinxia]XP_045451741.1 surfeit locus protein 6 homolog isoform X1 [Melitaea cinxia]XP_045451742.1 surfeit locus protein 6 homolog isoform X1 [Melitaea cinxia]XP_045451743.1 surfeit locus protein 6 homolog isoform X1 [Melitaea cinxia]XP_045451752.1 surfeit locus protein 6 homolog isoform X1 [
MAVQKKSVKVHQLRKELTTELNSLKNIFSVLSIPLPRKDEDESQMDIEITNETNNYDEKKLPHRARSIIELEEKLDKIKSQNNYNLKSKLAKKSLNSKLNKKIKKRERVKLNPNKIKNMAANMENKEVKVKPNANIAKPIFNNEGKLVFSKFDFAKLGEKDRGMKSKKDPKKILNELQQQEEKFQKIAEIDSSKAKELKEKVAWKNILQKAEGEKVKDDPTLLKKSIKKMEKKKKISKKKWEGRIQSVEKKKQDRQQKRKENISKKKKEKKSKIVKAAVKRGRVVI